MVMSTKWKMISCVPERMMGDADSIEGEIPTDRMRRETLSSGHWKSDGSWAEEQPRGEIKESYLPQERIC